jgi:hypothetical protein
MCISCFSNGEVWAANAVMVGGLGNQLALRFRIRRTTAEQRLLRRKTTWDRNAEFLSDLGLDPESSLGPRPRDLPDRPF